MSNRTTKEDVVDYNNILEQRIKEHNLFGLWQGLQKKYPSKYSWRFHKSYKDFFLRILAEAAFEAKMIDEGWEILQYCNEMERMSAVS